MPNYHDFCRASDDEIQQGATWTQSVEVVEPDEVTPSDLTGYTARMMVKETRADTTPLFELTTENGGLTIDATAGVVTIEVSATITAAIEWRLAIYDLELVLGDSVERILEGTIECTPEVTR